VKPNSAGLATDHSPALEFPIVPDFVSLPRHANAAATIEMCDFYVRKFSGRPEFRQQQNADRCEIEFDLQQPRQFPTVFPSALIDELIDATCQR
jgi:hypothetical protein